MNVTLATELGVLPRIMKLKTVLKVRKKFQVASIWHRAVKIRIISGGKKGKEKKKEFL